MIVMSAYMQLELRVAAMRRWNNLLDNKELKCKHGGKHEPGNSLYCPEAQSRVARPLFFFYINFGWEKLVQIQKKKWSGYARVGSSATWLGTRS